MKKSYVIIAVVVLLAVGVIKMYNTIVMKNQNTLESWSNVESALQRRYDLIPNLVNTVKGYATHEKQTLEDVIKARSSAMSTSINVDLKDPKSFENLMQVQSNLSGALSKLIAVSERYPDLKASQNFLDLQSQLEGTENRINVARVRYNESAKLFNTAIITFPGNIINSMLSHFKEFQYFKSDAQAAKAPVVSF